MRKTELLERLAHLDEEAALLFDDDRRFQLVIAGGGALILLETITRATEDIDALEASSAIRPLLAKYDINLDVNAYINNFAYNYEDRLVPLLAPGKKIDFYTVSLEDIVVAKLFSRRDSDRQDLADAHVWKALDWNRLERLATDEHEVRQSVMNDRQYSDFLANYEEYVRRYRPCGR